MQLRRRIHRDEAGSALVIAIAFMLVMSILGAAVLRQLMSASVVHSSYSSVHRREFALDGAIDLTVRGLRYEPYAGVPSPTGTTCTSVTLPGSRLGGYTFEGTSYDVYCATTPESGQAIATGRADRFVTISICDAGSNCATGKVQLRSYIQFDDASGNEIGLHALTRSWIRNPAS